MPQTRQLAAIMFTDIVGYTALMGEDEQRAFEILDKNRKLQKPLIEQYGGKWIKELGDGVLACFTTVSDAVNAAIKIQEACNVSKDFLLRISIHHGEVVFEDNDIFGDAVNIASRIQALAPIGGIWISESVHHNVSNKREVITKFVRAETLKHVKEPVRIYEVIINNNQRESLNINSEKPATTIPNNSIAVLPFVNMSSDPEQEFFSDGLTEEIISDLSRIKKLIVISRSSIMTFKGTNKKIKEIATELNTHFILEGSVRKSGNSLRITAQLIDALNDCHAWTEKFTGTLDDVFDIQEKVSRAIVDALDLKLTRDEEVHLSQHPIQDTKAYECYIRARQEIWKFNETGLDNAIALAQRGLDLVGDNALLYATLSLANLFIPFYGIRPDVSYWDKARLYASKSLQMDPNSLQAHFVQGLFAFKNANKQQAANIFKTLLEKDPNNPEALHLITVCCFLSGKPEAGRPYAERLVQVDPLTTISHCFPGFIELFNGNFAASLPYHKKWLQMDPNGPFTRYWSAADFVLNNMLEEGIEVLEAMIRDTPTLVFGKFAQFFKSALLGDRESALKYATEDFKQEASMLDFLPLFTAWGYVLINEKEEAMKWLKKNLDSGQSPYPFLLKIEIFHTVLKDHDGFQEYMEEIKKRSEQFVV